MTELILFYTFLQVTLWSSIAFSSDLSFAIVFCTFLYTAKLVFIKHNYCFADAGFQLSGFKETMMEGKYLLRFLGLFFLADLFIDFGFIDSLINSHGYAYSVLFQQFIMVGYFANRLQEKFTTPTVTMLVVCIFMSVHIPNIPLMIVSGIGMFYLYDLFLTHRNIYAIIILHYTISNLANLLVFKTLGLSMAVGPFY
jgi:hypothetical protein